MSAIVVEGLRKTYGDLAAVDDLSFEVAEGEVFCVLGPNGAGKTTTVEILEGHRDRTAGRVEVLGYDPQTSGREYRERIGIVLQEAGVDEDFSVRELVRLYRGMYPRRRDVDELIDLVGLTDKRDARVKTLSGGQRRRLDLALGLVGDPDLLFLDEPTTGFDPSARRKAWGLIENLRALGKTILLTTHYMDEAQHLADRVAVIAKGRLIALGTPEDLSTQQGEAAVLSFRLPAGVAATDLPDLGPGVRRVRASGSEPAGGDQTVRASGSEPAGGDQTVRASGSEPAGGDHADGPQITMSTESPTGTLSILTAWAAERGVELESLQLARPTLEDTYLRLVGGPDGN